MGQLLQALDSSSEGFLTITSFTVGVTGYSLTTIGA
jgi:hypothetical protein